MTLSFIGKLSLLLPLTLLIISSSLASDDLAAVVAQPVRTTCTPGIETTLGYEFKLQFGDSDFKNAADLFLAFCAGTNRQLPNPSCAALASHALSFTLEKGAMKVVGSKPSVSVVIHSAGSLLQWSKAHQPFATKITYPDAKQKLLLVPLFDDNKVRNEVYYFKYSGSGSGKNFLRSCNPAAACAGLPYYTKLKVVPGKALPLSSLETRGNEAQGGDLAARDTEAELEVFMQDSLD